MKQEEKRFDKMRCNLYLPTELVEAVDEMAKTYGAPRNVMVAFILKTYLDQQEVVKLATNTISHFQHNDFSPVSF